MDNSANQDSSSVLAVSSVRKDNSVNLGNSTATDSSVESVELASSEHQLSIQLYPVHPV